MHNINFISVEVEGFRTIVKPLKFDLMRPGLNMIKGTNGAGKTSVFEALIWCLYGVNLKEVNQAQLVTWPENRGSMWQGTRVEVTFTIGPIYYKISRHLGYKGLTHDVKGEDYLMLAKGDGMRQLSEVNDYRNKDLTQQAINQLLGLDVKTFSNSILFGQRVAKLIQQDNKDKRELFEILFDTFWVSDAKTKCDADIAQLIVDQVKLQAVIYTCNTTIETKKLHLVTTKDLLNSFEEGRTTRLNAAKLDLAEYNKTLAVLVAEITSYEEAQKLLAYDAEAHTKLEEQFNALEKQFNEANLAQTKHVNLLSTASNLVITKKSEVTRLQLEVDKLMAKHIEENCPYCEQELKPGNKLEINHNADIIAATDKVKAADIALKEAEKALKALQKVKAPATPESITKEKEAIEGQLTAMDALLLDYNTQAENIKDATVDKVQAEKDILRITNTIETIKAEKPPVVDIKAIEDAIANEQKKLETAQQDKLKIEQKLVIAEWWSKKAFGAGGLKAYVFSAMLTTLNKIVKKYGDRLGASLEFSIDLTKASKPFTTRCSLGDKIDKDYKDFSGGEKDRLDIVLMFSMFDLISMGTDINLLIMDEPFSGLDEEGESLVFDLVREKAETGKSVFVISHSPTLNSLYANKIEFAKINGNTVIVN